MVQVIRVPAANEGGAPIPLVSAAEVTSTAGAITDTKTNANSSLNITVLVPSAKLNTVAAAAAAKTLVVGKLSPNSKPEVSRNGGSN